ncbi:thialysine N-epsilon-acetyltransferase-like [Anas acuta]|uniref:thialysine N-epsilon-acetyltransferase-like n=1 Tax=Anas acuta TaxID=28680 RepID=UPI0035C89117
MGWEVRACTGPELVRMLREWAALEPGPQPPPEEAQLRDLLGAQPPPSSSRPRDPLRAPPPGGVLGGFAVASWGFSTWRGRDLRLGELWVPPALRGQGVPELLLQGVAQEALAAGCSQLRVELPPGGGAWDAPPGEGTDLGAAEGWGWVSFGGGALQRLAGGAPP